MPLPHRTIAPALAAGVLAAAAASLSIGGLRPSAARAQAAALPPEPAPVGHLMNNCALSRFQFEPERALIVYQNRVNFLPTELVTY